MHPSEISYNSQKYGKPTSWILKYPPRIYSSYVSIFHPKEIETEKKIWPFQLICLEGWPILAGITYIPNTGTFTYCQFFFFSNVSFSEFHSFIQQIVTQCLVYRGVITSFSLSRSLFYWGTQTKQRSKAVLTYVVISLYGFLCVHIVCAHMHVYMYTRGGMCMCLYEHICIYYLYIHACTYVHLHMYIMHMQTYVLYICSHVWIGHMPRYIYIWVCICVYILVFHKILLFWWGLYFGDQCVNHLSRNYSRGYSAIL